jgi:hypothetical protein
VGRVLTEKPLRHRGLARAAAPRACAKETYATGLLPDLTIRSAGRPQRGPWPLLVNAVITTVVLGAAFLLWRGTRP